MTSTAVSQRLGARDEGVAQSQTTPASRPTRRPVTEMAEASAWDIRGAYQDAIRRHGPNRGRLRRTDVWEERRVAICRAGRPPNDRCAVQSRELQEDTGPAARTIREEGLSPARDSLPTRRS